MRINNARPLTAVRNRDGLRTIGAPSPRTEANDWREHFGAVRPSDRRAGARSGRRSSVSGTVVAESDVVGLSRSTSVRALTLLAMSLPVWAVVLHPQGLTGPLSLLGAHLLSFALLWIFLIVIAKIVLRGFTGPRRRAVARRPWVTWGMPTPRARREPMGVTFTVQDERGRPTQVWFSRHLRIPLGSAVQVIGPRVLGGRDAWFVRRIGQDDALVPARGVLRLFVTLAISTLLAVAVLTSGAGA